VKLNTCCYFTIKGFDQKEAHKKNDILFDNLIIPNMFTNEVLSIIVGETIQCCYVHPVTFKMVFRQLELGDAEQIIADSRDDRDPINPDTKFVYNQESFDQLTWESVIFGPTVTKLTLASNGIGNDDNRGGGCGFLGLPIDDFKYTIKNKSGITLRNLTEGVYRMKGSKYDWWYELYGYIDIECLNGKHYSVKANFGYGS
jgi:hypothetical protein